MANQKRYADGQQRNIGGEPFAWIGAMRPLKLRVQSIALKAQVKQIQLDNGTQGCVPECTKIDKKQAHHYHMDPKLLRRT